MRRTLLLCLVPLIAACSGVELEPTIEVDRVTVEDEAVSLPVGYAVAVEIVSAGSGSLSVMITRDEAVAGVAPTGGTHEFVIYGEAAGQTVLDVHIDGTREGQIEVQIEPN